MHKRPVPIVATSLLKPLQLRCGFQAGGWIGRRRVGRQVHLFNKIACRKIGDDRMIHGFNRAPAPIESFPER